MWIDFFNGRDARQVDVLARLIEVDAGIALTDIILTEVLQGSGRTSGSGWSMNYWHRSTSSGSNASMTFDEPPSSIASRVGGASPFVALWTV